MVNVKTREALTVNVKTTETEGNTLRSLSTWAESSEKGLHPGLVQHKRLPGGSSNWWSLSTHPHIEHGLGLVTLSRFVAESLSN